MNARLLGIVCACLAFLNCAHATDDDEEKQAFSMWNYAVPATGAQFPYIAYEVQRTGFHSAEIHFKNFNPKPIGFSFQLPGFQGAAGRVQSLIAPSAPNDHQTVVPVKLDRGTSGLTFSALMLYGVKIGDQPLRASSGSPSNDNGFAPPPDEAWFGVSTSQTYPEFGLESACCRIVADGVGRVRFFANTSREPLFFDSSRPGIAIFRDSQPACRFETSRGTRHSGDTQPRWHCAGARTGARVSYFAQHRRQSTGRRRCGRWLVRGDRRELPDY